MTDSPANTNPIVVSASPVPGAVAALARQLALAACGWAVANGYFGQSVSDQIFPILVGLLILGYGQVKTWVLHLKAARMADLLPNSKAVTK